MQQKSKTNWWVIAAVIIIGVPIGFVIMGIINRNNKHVDNEENAKLTIRVDTLNKEKQETVEETNVKFETVKPSEVKAEDRRDAKPSLGKANQIGNDKKNDDVKPKPAIQPKKEETPEEIEKRRQEQEIRRRQEAERQEQLAEQRRIEQERKAKEEQERKQKEEAERLKALERQREQQEALRIQREEARKQLLGDVQEAMNSGKKSSVVPDGCMVIINDKTTTDYQDFRNGIRLGSYSNVDVTNIECDDSGVTKVYVNVIENDEEESE